MRISPAPPKVALQLTGHLFLSLLVTVVLGPVFNSVSAVPFDSAAEQTAARENGEITVIPKINILAENFWADGATPALIWISLEATRGNERWVHKAQEEIAFHLGPGNGSFVPHTVTISPGQSKSTETRLTAKTPGSVEVTCTSDRRYDGVTILPCQPAKINFVFPIDSIGIEPVAAKSAINIATPFLVFLCNRNNPQVKLQPTSEVSIQLESENGNGNISESKITLTNAASSHLVRYMGTRLGGDSITANATYAGNWIKGNSKRTISFPWFTFLIGLAGALLGSAVKSKFGEPARRWKDFVESFVFGLAFCLIVILFPAGTKLGISEHVQPWVIFAFAIVISFLGPEALKQVLSVFSNAQRTTS